MTKRLPALALRSPASGSWPRAYSERRRSLLFLLIALPGCALDAPPATSVLGAPPDSRAAPSALGERGRALQAEIDALSAEALAQADANRADFDLALAAAQRLFEAADLRIQLATLDQLQARPELDPTRQQAVDDDLPDELRMQVLALTQAGRDAAQRALGRRADDVGARLYLALNLTLIAWAKGATRALFGGDGPRVRDAIERAVECDAAFDHAAPLRLQGRFLASAPWPYHDAAQARTVLTRAVAIASLAVNHLFLGDVLWTTGERDAAREQWRLALDAPDDASTRFSTPVLREIARRRLLSSR